MPDENRFSKGVIESTRENQHSRENNQILSVIPEYILENSKNADATQRGIEELLNAYYDFNNLNEFLYVENDTYEDVVINGIATFRISDDNEFFKDNQFLQSTLKDALGNTISVPSQNVRISNGNNLPGSLSESREILGKTLRITGLSSYDNTKLSLTTPIQYYVGSGPSRIINKIEDAFNLDATDDVYLGEIQKQIATVIPKNVMVDKRSLYKNIVQFYKERGTEDSIKTFFRMLYEDNDVDIEYPYDHTLKASDGRWDSDNNVYLDNNGFPSNTLIKIQDSIKYQKYSYVIKSSRNIEEWSDVFNKLIHPAGFIYFGEILIFSDLVRDVLGDSSKSATVQLSSGELQTVRAYPRTNRKTWSSMPGIQPGVLDAEELATLIESFASMFVPTFDAKIHKSAQLSLELSSTGSVENIIIDDRGYGYSVAPTITITGTPTNGNSIVQATATTTIDSKGSIDTITIGNAGNHYNIANISVTENSNEGSVADITIVGRANKEYRNAPTIVIDAPTSTDRNGNLLSTNIQATAKVVLDLEGEISSVTITNSGSGYVKDPKILTYSATSNERRAKSSYIVSNITTGLNSDGTINHDNNYHNAKKSSNVGQDLIFGNYLIEQFSNTQIANVKDIDISKINQNAIIS